MNNSRYHKFNINSQFEMPKWRYNIINKIQKNVDNFLVKERKKKMMNMSEDDLFNDNDNKSVDSNIQVKKSFEIIDKIERKINELPDLERKYKHNLQI